jgi:uncharacterized membrane protein YbaN (DUF454 family)
MGLMTGSAAASPVAPQLPPDPTTISPVWRAVLLVVGTASLLVGLIGVVLPILPTTPFLLVAAACYARASTRLYRWLIGQRSLGPIITEWRRSRSLPPGVKGRALVAVVITFTLSVFLVDVTVVRVLLVITGLILAAFLARIPTAPAEAISVNMGSTPPPEELP